MEKILSIAILAVVYGLFMSGRVPRTTAVMLGIVLVLGFGLITVEEAVDAVNWEALGLIFGMLILVAALSASGFSGDWTSGPASRTVTALREYFSSFAASRPPGGVHGQHHRPHLHGLPHPGSRSGTRSPSHPVAQVLRGISAVQGIPVTSLAWTLALGADTGGNGAPWGGSANVVGLAVAEKGGVRVSRREYMRIALPMTILAVAVANVLIILRYG